MDNIITKKKKKLIVRRTIRKDNRIIVIQEEKDFKNKIDILENIDKNIKSNEPLDVLIEKTKENLKIINNIIKPNNKIESEKENINNFEKNLYEETSNGSIETNEECNYKEEKINQNNKICFMFLTRGNIYHEKIWKTFFDYADSTKYSILIHPQNPNEIKTEFFRQFIIDDIIPVKWGNILTAWIHMLKKMYIDENNTHFVWLSESCIPMKSFEEIYESTKNIKSPMFTKFHEQFRIRYGQWTIFPRCNPIAKNIPKHFIDKQQAWCILTRDFIKLYLENEEFINKNIFTKNYTAPEEHVFITFANYFNIKYEYNTELNSLNCVTFALWKYDKDYKYKKEFSKDLYEYIEITNEELNFIAEHKCWFARKFKHDCLVKIDEKYIRLDDYWYKFIKPKIFNVPYSVIVNRTYFGKI